MPLARYFSYVGGVLLALLFILDAYLPKIPVGERADANLPIIRIHSDQKWPARVVFDTSVPAITPSQVASREPDILPPEAAKDVSVKAKGRDALAQIQSSDTRLSPPHAAKKKEAKLQRRTRIARRYTPPRFTSSRRWQFGWFGQSPWRGG